MNPFMHTSSGDAVHRLKRDAASLLCNLLIFGVMVGGLVWMHVDNKGVEQPAAPPSTATNLGPASR